MTASRKSDDGIIDLAHSFVALRDGGALESMAQRTWPPERFAGYSIGIWETDRPAPHNGEMHPDGDELLIVLDGKVMVTFDSDDGARSVPVERGQAHIVARGLWHRVIPQGPCRLLYATPGPNVEVRPIAS